MVVGLKLNRPPAPAPVEAPDVAELLGRWREQTARVAAAGDALADELRGLVEIYQDAAAAYPGKRSGDGYVEAAAAGLELPSRLVGLLTGGESGGFHGGILAAWKEQSRLRGWLD